MRADNNAGGSVVELEWSATEPKNQKVPPVP
jgi:hypothetical protein